MERRLECLVVVIVFIRVVVVVIAILVTQNEKKVIFDNVSFLNVPLPLNVYPGFVCAVIYHFAWF